MDFLLWRSMREAGRCGLSPTDIEDVHRLHAGEVVPADFAQPIEYPMSDSFPDDIELSDNYEVAGQIVISSKLRGFLQGILPRDRTQYLPAKIINHKGRVAADDYSILHLHDVCDCIDQDASKVKWNLLNKSKMIGCKSLVLNQHAVDASLQAFRLKFWGSKIVVRSGLAAALKKEGFVGLRFMEPAKYTGVG